MVLDKVYVLVTESMGHEYLQSLGVYADLNVAKEAADDHDATMVRWANEWRAKRVPQIEDEPGRFAPIAKEPLVWSEIGQGELAAFCTFKDRYYRIKEEAVRGTVKEGPGWKEW